MRIVSKRGMTLRFLLALGLMAFLSAGSFFIAADIFQSSETSSKAVDMSGRQRMLTFRILSAYLGMRLGEREDADARARKTLAESVDELSRLRDVFRRGAPEYGIPAPTGGRLREIYFEPPDNLAERLDAFIANAKRALGMSREELRRNDAVMEEMLSADGPLLTVLDKSVAEYARENDAQARLLLRLELAAMVLSLFALAAIGLFIFRPMRDAIVRERVNLAEANARLERLAAVDPLTGVSNRLKFSETFAGLAAMSVRYGEPVSCLMLDIDHFKAINDLCGHPTGDAVLIKIAGMIQDNIRETDHLFRWGGEEFLLLLPHTDTKDAAVAAEKLRAVAERTDFGCEMPVTVSLGAATLAPGESAECFVSRADAAMYEAKRAGRNRVRLAPEDGGECLLPDA